MTPFQAMKRPWKAITKDGMHFVVTDKNKKRFPEIVCRSSNPFNALLIVRAVNRDHLFERMVQLLDGICKGDFLYGQCRKDAKDLLAKMRREK